jgi:4-amino-4-deoxy-L-arabinose transferase-like glycosyltransferase
MKIVTWAIVGVFVIVEVLLLMGVLFKIIDKWTFEIQLSVLSGVVFFGFNVQMVIVYFKFNGMPFKSDQHYQNLKYIGFVAIYWTAAFTLKYITSQIPSLTPSLQKIHKDQPQES